MSRKDNNGKSPATFKQQDLLIGWSCNILSLLIRGMLAIRRACHSLILVFLFSELRSLESRLQLSSLLGTTSKHNDRKCSKRLCPVGSQNLLKIAQLRGGSDISALDEPLKVVPSEVCAIVVSTSVGSIFLDKKKRLTISRNATVGDLKCMIEKKFPGCPPTGLQKLFLGVRALGDGELIGNITVTSPTPILLDMLTGTSVYNRTLSISQALEAHASLIVQQSYLGAKMRATYIDVGVAESASNLVADVNGTVMQPLLESGLYRDMFDAVNRTLYETYAEDIAEALEREKEPETLTDDTAAWRGKQKETKPLVAALAKEFDLNIRGIKSFFYYSILLGIFAFYGTTSAAATQFLLLLVPFLWISKLRQLRLVWKVIAIESSKWSTGADEEHSSGESSVPIVPQSKKGRGFDGIISMFTAALTSLLRPSGAGEAEEEEEGGDDDIIVDEEQEDGEDDDEAELETEIDELEEEEELIDDDEEVELDLDDEDDVDIEVETEVEDENADLLGDDTAEDVDEDFGDD